MAEFVEGVPALPGFYWFMDEGELSVCHVTTETHDGVEKFYVEAVRSDYLWHQHEWKYLTDPTPIVRGPSC